MLKKFKVRRGAQSPAHLIDHSVRNPMSKKSLRQSDSMDGCNVLPETQFVGTRQRVDTTRVLSVGVPFPLGDLPERGQSLTSNRL